MLLLQRRPELDFQHSHGASQPPVTLVPGDRIPSLDLCGHHIYVIHVHAGKTFIHHMHKINKYKLGVVTHACNLSTWEVEAAGSEGWRNGSVVKITDCSSRGLRFNSEHPCGCSQLKLQIQGIQHPHTDRYAGKTPRHINKNK